MAFPLIIRNKYLGSFHVAFKESPSNIDELTAFCGELSAQITIAVDNMLSYNEQRKKSEKLEKQKLYVLEKMVYRLELINSEVCLKMLRSG